MDRNYWERVMAVRDAVSRSLEPLRTARQIGSSLDAEADIYCDSELAQVLEMLGDELRFVLITSYARLHPMAAKPEDLAVDRLPGGGQVAVRVMPSVHSKCIRCWHHRQDVGASADHPEICGRSVENVSGVGERRLYA